MFYLIEVKYFDGFDISFIDLLVDHLFDFIACNKGGTGGAGQEGDS